MPRFSIQSNDMDQIFVDQGNSLWLGNMKAALNTSLLKEKNIRTVITVANNIVVRYKDMQHKVYRLDDNEHTPLISYFEEINAVIASGLLIGSVLVHCQAGVSRSSSCVIAYLMWSQKWSYEKTFYFVKEKRLTINPNPGFKRQLITYSQRLQAKKSTQSELNTPRNRYIGNQKDLIQKLKGMLVKSPKKIIEHLDISSTDEERQMYRLQLAKKLFLNTFQTRLETPRSPQPLLKLSLQTEFFEYNQQLLKLMQSSQISGWLQDYDHSSPMHQIVNQIVNRKQQKRSVSLCQRKQDQDHEIPKSNLIDRNRSQMLKPPKAPTSQNKIQELKKVMEFLQHNEQFKYETHRIFDPSNPKFSPQYQQMIENKKEQFKRKTQHLQPLQEISQPSDRQSQYLKKTRLKTDSQTEISKTHQIKRVSSIPKIHDNRQIIQKGLEFLQIMIERHKENVQHFLPKKSKNFK